MPPLWESRFMLPTARRTDNAAYTSRLSLVGLLTSRCRRLAGRTAQIKPCRLSTYCFQLSLAERSALVQPSRDGLAVGELGPKATAAAPIVATSPSTTLRRKKAEPLYVSCSGELSKAAMSRSEEHTSELQS